MKARDAMNPDVVSVTPDASLLDAAQLMLDRKISGLLVMDGGNLVGIITEGDLLRRAETGTARKRPRWLEFLVGAGKLADEYVHISGRKVHEVMTRDVHSVSDSADLEEVARIMEAGHVKRLPVTVGRSVVGVISRADLVRRFIAASKGTKAPLGDVEIHSQLMAHLESQHWAPTSSIGVAVKDGIVKLSGVVLDDRQISAVEVAAENIPGVTKVINEIVWLEPVSGMVVDAAGHPKE